MEEMTLGNKIKLKRNDLIGEIVGYCPAGQGRNGVKSYRVAFDGFVGDIDEPLFLRLFCLESTPQEIIDAEHQKEMESLKSQITDIEKKTEEKYISELSKLQTTIKNLQKENKHGGTKSTSGK